MASKLVAGRSSGRSLSTALRPAAVVGKRGPPSSVTSERCFATTARLGVNMPKEASNMRQAPRKPEPTLRAPLVNPADKYATKADEMHRYGSWLMGCLPKFVQQVSVWKDELTIYIAPEGVIPVFTFLKCEWWSQVPQVSCCHRSFPSI